MRWVASAMPVDRVAARSAWKRREAVNGFVHGKTMEITFRLYLHRGRYAGRREQAHREQ
ncbi:MAG: hypothetical protein ACLTZY_07610 [Alistipes indistinctus]